MLFFSRKKADAARGKSGLTTGKVLNVMFNPFTDNFSPINETVAVFSRLLAYIFASFGLFPINHPAFKGGRENIPTVGQVFATAWSRLAFNRRNIPQICLFFGIVAGLSAAVIAFFVTLFSVFISSAHAAVPVQSYYSPVDKENDIALGWINYLFKGQEVPNYLSGLGQYVPQSCLIQGAFIVALGFYSNAILIVAAIILFYHLTSMIVETAHEGKVMGKDGNQVWAPIRLVVAIGLLVPISTYQPQTSCAGFSGVSHSAGLNSGQYIVIKVAEWGSNLASQVWKRFMDYIANETFSGAGPVPPMAQKVVYDTMMSLACMKGYNYYFSGNGGGSSDETCVMAPAQTSIPNLKGAIKPISKKYSDGSEGHIYDFENNQLANDGVCGGYSFMQMSESSTPDVDDQTASKIKAVREQAFNSMVQEASGVVDSNLLNFVHVCMGGKDESKIPLNASDPFTNTVIHYIAALKAGMSDAMEFSAAMKRVAETSGKQGWVSAGAWFNTISRAQGAMMETTGLLPATTSPKINTAGDPIMTQNVWPALMAFNDWLEAVHPDGTSSSGNVESLEQQLMLASAGIKQSSKQGKQGEDMLDLILAQIDIIASWNGVWTPAFGYTTDQNGQRVAVQPTANQITSYGKFGSDNQQFALGVQFGEKVNPLAEITRLGHANIQTAYEIFDLYYNVVVAMGSISLGAELASGVALGSSEAIQNLSILGKMAAVVMKPAGDLVSIFGKLSESARQAIGGILATICTVFIVSGTLLAYFLPMIPFFSFLFGVVTWIIALLEAIICVPLIALAHLTPDGKGLPGPKALGAYHFLFNIFLRPVLMIFALMIALLIFYIAASYLNLFYMQAIVGTGGIAHGHVMFTRMVYSILYCAILYMVGQNCFKMISLLPTHAMKWGGLQSLTFHELGNIDQIGTYAAFAEQHVMGKITESVGRMSGPEGLMLKNWMQNPEGTHLRDGVNKLDRFSKDVETVLSPAAYEAQSGLGKVFGGAGNVARDISGLQGGETHKYTDASKEYLKDKAIDAGKAIAQVLGVGGGTNPQGEQPPVQQPAAPPNTSAPVQQPAASPNTPAPVPQPAAPPNTPAPVQQPAASPSASAPKSTN